MKRLLSWVTYRCTVCNERTATRSPNVPTCCNVEKCGSTPLQMEYLG
jgi:hypothetical protein